VSSYVGSVSQGRPDLLQRKLVFGRHGFDRLAGGNQSNDRCNINPGPRNAWLAEPDVWIHRDTGKHFHTAAFLLP